MCGAFCLRVPRVWACGVWCGRLSPCACVLLGFVLRVLSRVRGRVVWGCVLCGYMAAGTARVCGPSLSVLLCCGGVLLSHNLSVAVPLALPGLASRFEMLLGVSPVL